MADVPPYSVSSRETSRAENPDCMGADFPPASLLGERVSFGLPDLLQEIKNDLKYYCNVNCRFYIPE